MKAWLRTLNASIKPRFMPGGTQAKWFPIYDAIENFIFSSAFVSNYSRVHSVACAQRE